MELLLVLPAGYRSPSPDHGLVPVRMAYRVGTGPMLLGLPLPEDEKGGAMLMDCAGFSGEGDPLPCCQQILEECRRREYRGIICDFELSPTPCLGRLVTELDRVCVREGMTLYVPEPWAALAPDAQVLISSALTGGTLERRLQHAADQYGPYRPVLAVEWQREDLILPTEGRGEPLSQLALEDHIRRLEPAVFFDRGLCAHYYTYRDSGGRSHFVLFDTARSIRAKLSLARRMGLRAVLLAAPEMEGYWEEILA